MNRNTAVDYIDFNKKIDEEIQLHFAMRLTEKAFSPEKEFFKRRFWMKGCTYRQNKDIVFRKEGDEAILFNPDNSDIVVINSTGCFIWGLCDGKNNQKAIVVSMIKEFDTTVDKAEEDLLKFLSDLENKKFIEKV